MRHSSVIVSTDCFASVKLLSNEQSGRLFRALYEFMLDDSYVDPDPIIRIALIPFTQKIRESYCHIYFMRLKKDSTGEDFVKIGISTDLKNRVRQLEQFGFEIEIVHTETVSTAEEARKKERVLHRFYYHMKYTPVTEFIGHTECFHVSILNTIQK